MESYWIPLKLRASRTLHEHELRQYVYKVGVDVVESVDDDMVSHYKQRTLWITLPHDDAKVRNILKIDSVHFSGPR